MVSCATICNTMRFYVLRIHKLILSIKLQYSIYIVGPHDSVSHRLYTCRKVRQPIMKSVLYCGILMGSGSIFGTAPDGPTISSGTPD